MLPRRVAVVRIRSLATVAHRRWLGNEARVRRLAEPAVDSRNPLPTVDPSLPPALRDLLDKQAILELVHAYSRAVDRRDFALLESLYTTDGVDEHVGNYCGPAAGFVAWLRSALGGVDGTTHHVHNVTIAVDGDQAEGEVYLTAYNRLRGEDGALTELLQGLRYLDHYRREDGRWRFARRNVVCDWAQHGPAFWDPAHPLIAGKRFGRGDAEDASYGVLRSPVFARFDARRGADS